MHGDYVTVVPVSPDEVTEGDVILYQTNSKLIAHRVIRVCDAAGGPLRSRPEDRELCSLEAKEFSRQPQGASRHASGVPPLKCRRRDLRAKQSLGFAILDGQRPVPDFRSSRLKGVAHSSSHAPGVTLLKDPRPTHQGASARPHSGSSTPASVLSTQSCNSPQSSALSTQHCFILRGDAHVTDDHPVWPDQILGKIVKVKRNKIIRGRILAGRVLKSLGIYPLYLAVRPRFPF